MCQPEKKNPRYVSSGVLFGVHRAAPPESAGLSRAVWSTKKLHIAADRQCALRVHGTITILYVSRVLFFLLFFRNFHTPRVHLLCITHTHEYIYDTRKNPHERITKCSWLCGFREQWRPKPQRKCGFYYNAYLSYCPYVPRNRQRKYVYAEWSSWNGPHRLRTCLQNVPSNILHDHGLKPGPRRRRRGKSNGLDVWRGDGRVEILKRIYWSVYTIAKSRIRGRQKRLEELSWRL